MNENGTDRNVICNAETLSNVVRCPKGIQFQAECSELRDHILPHGNSAVIMRVGMTINFPFQIKTMFVQAVCTWRDR